MIRRIGLVLVWVGVVIMGLAMGLAILQILLRG
jgi:hypothetical protein